MSANCGDYGERRGVGICNEFPIAFMPHILWLCASAIQAEHPQGLETDKSDAGYWACALGRAAILTPTAARLGPFILLALFICDSTLVSVPRLCTSASFLLLFAKSVDADGFRNLLLPFSLAKMRANLQVKSISPHRIRNLCWRVLQFK